MSPSHSILLLGLAIATALAPSLYAPKAAQAQNSVCFEVQDSDGWSYVRRLESREIVGKLDNGTIYGGWKGHHWQIRWSPISGG